MGGIGGTSDMPWGWDWIGGGSGLAVTISLLKTFFANFNSFLFPKFDLKSLKFFSA